MNENLQAPTLPTKEALAIKRVPVISSFIAEIGYDQDRKWLVLATRSGHLYVYAGVSQSVYAEMLAAPSKGIFYNRVIREHYHAVAAGPLLSMPQTRSTAIRASEYNFEKEILTVEFGSGEPYRYHQVPERVWREFQASSSQGQYFNTNIRDLYPLETELEAASLEVDL